MLDFIVRSLIMFLCGYGLGSIYHDHFKEKTIFTDANFIIIGILLLIIILMSI